MKIVHTRSVENNAVHHLHEGSGHCLGGTLLDHAALGGGAWRFVDWWRIPPGHGIGPHRHRAGHELYVVLRGSATMTTNGVPQSVSAGDLILNEPGDWHSFHNSGGEEVIVLVTAVVDAAVQQLYVNCTEDGNEPSDGTTD